MRNIKKKIGNEYKIEFPFGDSNKTNSFRDHRVSRALFKKQTFSVVFLFQLIFLFCFWFGVQNPEREEPEIESWFFNAMAFHKFS